MVKVGTASEAKKLLEEMKVDHALLITSYGYFVTMGLELNN